MTGLTAKKFGLKDRGVLREGAFADLTLFDAGSVGEAATFEKPIAPARGIEQRDRQRRDSVARRQADRLAAGPGARADSGA